VRVQKGLSCVNLDDEFGLMKVDVGCSAARFKRVPRGILNGFKKR
jgi:hypothetical protein